MSSEQLKPTQNTEVTMSSTRSIAAQKIPFHKPQIGALRHLLRETGEKGKSKEYDSYSDNRP